MRDFIRWHYTRHASDRAIIDSYFGPEAYEAELRSLPGSYARLEGAFLQVEAQTLYRKLGFHDVAPYYELSPQLRDWLVFMKLDLG